MPMFLFYIQWKRQNCNDFREYRNGTLAWNGVTYSHRAFFITPIPGMSSMNTDILKHSFCKYKKLFKIIPMLSYFIDYFTLRWALIGSEFFSWSSLATDLLPVAWSFSPFWHLFTYLFFGFRRLNSIQFTAKSTLRGPLKHM